MTGLPSEEEIARADHAMHEIWRQWFSFYEKHFRGHGIRISAADQIAFYEIAQPILRALPHPAGRKEEAALEEPTAASRQKAFGILRQNGDCFRDDVSLNDLIDDIAAEIDAAGGRALKSHAGEKP